MSPFPVTVTSPPTLSYKTDKGDEPRRGAHLPANIGPEAMIGWLMVQMRRSNTDVRTALAEVERSRAKLDLLQDLQVSIREHKSACYKKDDVSIVSMSDDHGIKWSKYKGPDGKLDSNALSNEPWYQALSPEGKKAAVQFVCEGLDGSVKESEVDKFMDRVKDDVASINSENELLMIGLQHTMQTRNQAIQLASNVISVLDRAADSVIANMGK